MCYVMHMLFICYVLSLSLYIYIYIYVYVYTYIHTYGLCYAIVCMIYRAILQDAYLDKHDHGHEYRDDGDGGLTTTDYYY